jgi:hypothetical protein
MLFIAFFTNILFSRVPIALHFKSYFIIGSLKNKNIRKIGTLAKSMAGFSAVSDESQQAARL